MEYNTCNTNDELTHWGIKGMKWGIRRYQNKDGSLTAAGRKRRTALEDETDKSPAKSGSTTNTKSGAKNVNDDENATPKKKTVADMSDDELRAKVGRLQNEKTYYELERQISALNPKPVSKGKKFMDSLINDVVTPAAKNAGKAWLEKVMKDKLGLNQEDPIAKLEKQVKKLELTKKISDLKNDKKDDGYSLDELLEAYRNIPEETRQDLADAAKIQENLNKVNKKKNN